MLTEIWNSRGILCRMVWIHGLLISEAPRSTCAHPQLVLISWRLLLFYFNLIFSKLCLFWFQKKTTFLNHKINQKIYVKICCLVKLLLFDPNIPEFPHYLLVLVPLKLLFNLLPNRFFNGLSTVWSGRPGKQLTHQQHLQKCPVCIFIRCRSGQNIWLSNGSGISCIGLKKGWMEPLTPSYSGLPVWPGNVFCFFFPPRVNERPLMRRHWNSPPGPNRVKAAEVSGCRSRLALSIQKGKSAELLLSATQHSKVSGGRPLNKMKLLPLPGSEGMDVN